MSEETKWNWGLSFKSSSIIGATALEYDGYRIKEYLFPTGGLSVCMNESFKTDFRLHKDRYFLRSMLFGFQRYFGKWGGEMVPESDREYSQYYFTFLQCYRVKLPPVMIGVCSQFKYAKSTSLSRAKEAAAADLRHCLSALGDNDIGKWDPSTMLETLRNGFDDNCTKRLPENIATRPEVILANACDNDILFRLAQHECKPNAELSKLNLAPVRDAFTAYVKKGRVDDDDNINRLVFKMLQWYLAGHPQNADFSKRSYILFALMYLHLYRAEFTRFAGIPARVAAWNAIPWSVREDVAARFRKHLSIMREEKAKEELTHLPRR